MATMVFSGTCMICGANAGEYHQDACSWSKDPSVPFYHEFVIEPPISLGADYIAPPPSGAIRDKLAGHVPMSDPNAKPTTPQSITHADPKPVFPNKAMRSPLDWKPR